MALDEAAGAGVSAVIARLGQRERVDSPAEAVALASVAPTLGGD